jgi:hypothetical protein
VEDFILRLSNQRFGLSLCAVLLLVSSSAFAGFFEDYNAAKQQFNRLQSGGTTSLLNSEINNLIQSAGTNNGNWRSLRALIDQIATLIQKEGKPGAERLGGVKVWTTTFDKLRALGKESPAIAGARDALIIHQRPATREEIR